MEELLNALIAYAGVDYEDSQLAFCANLINEALEEVMGVMYPYGFRSADQQTAIQEMALSRYPGKILRIAEFHYDKQGKEGVKSFSENSTSSSYEGSGTPASLLKHIIPVSQII